MTYIVHINPVPGTESKREVEVEADYFGCSDGVLSFFKKSDTEYPHYDNACFSPGVWIYVEPKK